MSKKDITKEENEKYEREDSETGYASKASETALLKASRKYDVISNNLLGNYDENGHYSIPVEILTELAGLKKIVGVTNEFGTELKAPYKDGITFNFLLKMGEEDKETHKKESTIYLMEVVSKVNGYIQNILTTPVATYTYKFDEHYKEYCYRAFHIVANIDETDDGALNGDAININKRFEYLNAVKNASKDQYLILEESFFNARLQILNELPQGALVLSEFNKKRSALEKYFMNNPKNKYRALNELLTSILEAYFDELEDTPAYKIAIQILIMKYLNQVNSISTQIKATEEYKKAKEAPVVKVPGAAAPAPAEKKPAKGSVKISSGGSKKSSGPKADKIKDAKYSGLGKNELASKIGGGSGSAPKANKNENKNVAKNTAKNENKNEKPKVETKVETKQPRKNRRNAARAEDTLTEQNSNNRATGRELL